MLHRGMKVIMVRTTALTWGWLLVLCAVPLLSSLSVPPWPSTSLNSIQQGGKKSVPADDFCVDVIRGIKKWNRN